MGYLRWNEALPLAESVLLWLSIRRLGPILGLSASLALASNHVRRPHQSNNSHRLLGWRSALTLLGRSVALVEHLCARYLSVLL